MRRPPPAIVEDGEVVAAEMSPAEFELISSVTRMETAALSHRAVCVSFAAE